MPVVIKTSNAMMVTIFRIKNSLWLPYHKTTLKSISKSRKKKDNLQTG
jgi:hypothetical protein